MAPGVQVQSVEYGVGYLSIPLAERLMAGKVEPGGRLVLRRFVLRGDRKSLIGYAPTRAVDRLPSFIADYLQDGLFDDEIF